MAICCPSATGAQLELGCACSTSVFDTWAAHAVCVVGVQCVKVASLLINASCEPVLVTLLTKAIHLLC